MTWKYQWQYKPKYIEFCADPKYKEFNKLGCINHKTLDTCLNTTNERYLARKVGWNLKRQYNP